MPQNEAAGIDPLAGGTFSRLLFSDAELDADTLMGFNHHDITSFTFSSDQKPPKMLCFGPDCINGNINAGSTTTTTDDKSSTNSTTTSLSSNSNMKRNTKSDYYQPVNVSTSFTTTETTVPPPRTTRRNNKKMKTVNTPPASHAKVKKEKLGERIAALQQMVSPYGKTDTASVLHEAMGYIKFLQEQVQVLCSPYLKRLSSTHIGDGDGDGDGERKKKDLRSQGLCLVPVDCTHHVAESNGADLWSPAMVNRQGGSSALH